MPTLPELYLNEGWWIDHYCKELIFADEIRDRRKRLSNKFKLPITKTWWEPISQVPFRPCSPLNVDCDSVTFGSKEALTEKEHKVLDEALRSLIPWRKGPWNIFGHTIDAEWRSNLKWDRIAPHLPSSEGMTICDIGCNNEYYMFRLLSKKPRFIVGIDPMIRYFFYHQLFKRITPELPLAFDLLGVEDIHLFKDFFDLILYMGVLYHRRDPIQSLTKCAESLKKGGTIILESIVIPIEEPYCLFPGKRYMKAPGYWFIPTPLALTNMLERTGFESVEIFNISESTTDEQHRTEWARFESFENFLHPTDKGKTIEGYPAPARAAVKATKR